MAIQLLDAERRRTEELYASTLQSLRAKTWDLAKGEAMPAVEAALSEKQAEQFMRCLHQLHILVNIHWKIGPERSYRKLLAATNAMQHTGARKTIAIAVRQYLEDNLLPYGALIQVIEGNFTTRVSDVHGILDRYKWRENNAIREHMHKLLCRGLRAMADFREVVHSTEVAALSQSMEKRELEITLRGAHERMKDTIARMKQHHAAYFSDHLFEMLSYELLRRAEGEMEVLMEALS